MSTKRYCQLDGSNVVINIIVINESDAAMWDANGYVPDDGTAMIGSTWNGTTFDPPPDDEPKPTQA